MWQLQYRVFYSLQLPDCFVRPAKVDMVEAMFDYTPQHVGHLEIKVGDKLEVTRRGDDGWWTGTLRGVHGNFPGVSTFGD